MLPEPIELKLGTSAENSISWSTDGQIAIAAGEEVCLLQPNHGDDSLERPWHELHFHVCSFLEEEWPAQSIPRATDGLFIGREQQMAEISALAWSSPGLAKHDRCVLAVLMSNGLLSLWVPGVEPLSSSGWTKRLSVSLAIAEAADRRDKSYRDNIRAFAWRRDTTAAGQVQHLAVLTEEEDLVILEISREGLGLHGQVLGVNTSERPEKIPRFRNLIESSHKSFEVRWDNHPNVNGTDGDGGAEFAAVHTVASGVLKTTKLKYIYRGDKKILTFQPHGKAVPAHGPIELQGSQISYFWQGRLQSVDLSNANAADVTGDRGEPAHLGSVSGWDAPIFLASLGSPSSNAGPDYSPPSLLPVGFLSVLQTVNIGTRQAGRVPRLIGRANPADSHLAKAIQDGIEAFSSEHSLNNKVFVRFHGLATFGAENDFVALLVTYWPREQIVYQIKASDRTHIIFSHKNLEYSGKSVSRETLRFPWQERRHSQVEKNEFPNILSTIDSSRTDLTPKEWAMVFLQLCGSTVREDATGVREALRILKTLDKGVWSRQIYGSPAVVLAQESGNPLDIANALIECSADYKVNMVERCDMPGCSLPVYFDSDERHGDTAKCTRIGHVYGKCPHITFWDLG